MTRNLSAEEFNNSYPKAVLLHHQPTEFSIATEDAELREWEEILVRRVGLSASVKLRIADEIHANGGTCCESGSPSNDSDED